MKKNLAALLFLLSSAHYCNAQNNRWLFISKTYNHTYLFIDTIRDDIKQDVDTRYGESHTVSFWIMYYTKTTKNKKSIIEKNVQKIKVDTVSGQYQTSNMVLYRNFKVVNSDPAIWDWTEPVPGTMAEFYIKFAKSVNNKKIRDQFLVTSFLSEGTYPKLYSNE
ncbi:hypothetical protein PQ469_14735 [Mucilaginibacter sp. KACC 22773]|uniref:hypothetical protein n=1 Tax=Mucilaginibacter sp. KACC 22773 TaxID=3025671 RepID=UPI0023661E4F|nr:hypothetical protein [Mucilaginibacter sp. KACC 22773]WDF81266.1 hypothetical protein PQ469_14735 [Mucilaginibacter sp. KACC 22773]